VSNENPASRPAGEAQFAVWLRPSEPQYGRFQAIIRELARSHGTPLFAPHVTLISGRKHDELRLPEKIARWAGEQPPLSLAAGPIDVTDERFRALFLSLVPGESQALFSRARGELSIDSDFRPHLSLMYTQDLPRARKEGIARDLIDRLPDKEIHFDSLQLVESGLHVWDDVTAWRVLQTNLLNLSQRKC